MTTAISYAKELQTAMHFKGTSYNNQSLFEMQKLFSNKFSKLLTIIILSTKVWVQLAVFCYKDMHVDQNGNDENERVCSFPQSTTSDSLIVNMPQQIEMSYMKDHRNGKRKLMMIYLYTNKPLTMTNSTRPDITFGAAGCNTVVAKQKDSCSTPPADKQINEEALRPNHPSNNHKLASVRSNLSVRMNIQVIFLIQCDIFIG